VDNRDPHGKRGLIKLRFSVVLGKRVHPSYQLNGCRTNISEVKSKISIGENLEPLGVEDQQNMRRLIKKGLTTPPRGVSCGR